MNNDDLSTNPVSPIDIPRVTGVHVGEILADWGGQGLLLTVFCGDGAVLRPWKEFGPTARIGWNDEGLVIQVQVVDSTPFEIESLGQLYEGDSVELMVGTTNPKDGLLQIITSPGRTESQPLFRKYIIDQRDKGLRDSAPAAGRSFSTTTELGYTVDTIIPWATLNLEPEFGLVVGARINVNDGDLSGNRANVIWESSRENYSFFDLPHVRLAESGSQELPIAVWGGFEEMKTTCVHMVAVRQLAGRKMQVREGDTLLGEATLTIDGERAVASVRAPAPPIEGTLGPLTILLDDEPVPSITLPDITQKRQELFQMGGDAFRWAPPSAWLTPRFERSVFTGSQFPPFGYDEIDRIEALVGPVEIQLSFFDSGLNPVERADAPGRYGAIATITNMQGLSITAHRTLFRQPDGVPIVNEKTANSLAHEYENRPTSDHLKTDRDWWHAMRKSIGTAIQYEYFVGEPRGYSQDPDKRWPVIFYLHGAGGGNAWESVYNEEIQLKAKTDSDFPFLVVSLKSPGGWHPPAVKDVMDEIEAKYRIDPDREYVTGFSMGGMGTWNVAYDQPARFAAFAPVGGRRGDPSRMELVKDVPAWIFNGLDDFVTSNADALVGYEALKAVGGNVKYTGIPGADHGGSLNFAYSGQELYEWLLEQSLAGR